MKFDKVKIPLYQPHVSKNQKKYVIDCLDSNWISSKGKYVELFEKSFSKFTNSKFSIAVSNGTVAIHLALMAIKIKKEDEILVPSFTYIAPVNAISYVGAKPVFVDTDLFDLQMDISDLEKKITKRSRAILAVHVYGQPGNLEKIKKIANKFNLILIEDCAEALGSEFKEKKVGSFGDIATYSFYGNKTITTGEGGMVTTNKSSIFKRAIKLKSQGLSKNREYWHEIIGYNFRMTNICSAIGLAQIENLDFILEKKRKIAKFYEKNLTDLPLRVHQQSENSVHSFWLCSIILDDFRKRNKLRIFLKDQGIETRPFFSPVHKMEMYKKNGEILPNAELIHKKGINLPSWPDLRENDLKIIVSSIRSFFN
jgi:perosamine synthetase